MRPQVGLPPLSGHPQHPRARGLHPRLHTAVSAPLGLSVPSGIHPGSVFPRGLTICPSVTLGYLMKVHRVLAEGSLLLVSLRLPLPSGSSLGGLELFHACMHTHPSTCCASWLTKSALPGT